MRITKEIESHGIAILKQDDYNFARIFVSKDEATLVCRIDVPSTLNMTQDEADIYKVVSQGTYVPFHGRVGGNDNPEWNQLMEQLFQIREHIGSLMRLQQDIKVLSVLKGGKDVLDVTKGSKPSA